MSAAEESIVPSMVTQPAPSFDVGTDRFLNRPTGIDAWLEQIGDRINPILIKELRQALKSRQFTVSFWLLLLFGFAWSFMGISLMLPGVYFMPSGHIMLNGYFLILAIPLLVVVPFSAYRSLATEREDGTYELLSITSLSARQIVTGKLGSALLQMLVFYAALAPCIVFTYLLRGLDIGIILVVLVGTFFVSILFSTVGLVFAGMSRSRQWQALTSVLLLLLLLFFGFWWIYLMIALIYSSGVAINEPMFWFSVLFVVAIFFSFMFILISIAAAQNSFASDNRSTQIRVALLTQLCIFTGMMLCSWLLNREDEWLIVLLTIAGFFWTLYGMVLCSEVAELSPRARRRLPQTFLGRMFFTWFNPGSATGYLFTILSFGCVVLVTFIANMLAISYSPERARDVNELIPFGMLMCSYQALYLGVGRLIVLALRRVAQVTLTAGVLIQLLVVLGLPAASVFIEFWRRNFRDAKYSDLQAFNWFWSLVESLDGTWSIQAAVLCVIPMGLLMFLCQIILAYKEVNTARLAVPERVQVDDRN